MSSDNLFGLWVFNGKYLKPSNVYVNQIITYIIQHIKTSYANVPNVNFSNIVECSTMPNIANKNLRVVDSFDSVSSKQLSNYLQSLVNQSFNNTKSPLTNKPQLNGQINNLINTYITADNLNRILNDIYANSMNSLTVKSIVPSDVCVIDQNFLIRLFVYNLLSQIGCNVQNSNSYFNQGTTNQPNNYQGTSNQPTNYQGAIILPGGYQGTTNQPTNYQGTTNQATNYQGTTTQPTNYQGTANQPNNYQGAIILPGGYQGTTNQPNNYQGTTNQSNNYQGTNLCNNYQGNTNLSDNYQGNIILSNNQDTTNLPNTLTNSVDNNLVSSLLSIITGTQNTYSRVLAGNITLNQGNQEINSLLSRLKEYELDQGTVLLTNNQNNKPVLVLLKHYKLTDPSKILVFNLTLVPNQDRSYLVMYSKKGPIVIQNKVKESDMSLESV